MVTIHYGGLGNREVYPFTFGILGADYIKAFIDLIVRNYWISIILLYSESVEANLIEQNIKNEPGYEVAFASPIYDYFIPLREARQSLAREEETLKKLFVHFAWPFMME